MNAIIFALISYFAWGIGILFEAIAARKIESNSATLWGLILGFVLSSLYAPFAINELRNLDLYIIFINLVVAFFFIFGTVIYYEALKKGNPSLVGTIASSFPIVVVLLSLFFLHEKVSNLQAVAIVVIFVGLILSTLDINTFMKKGFLGNKGIILAIVAMMSWGIAFTFVKIPIAVIGWFWPNYFIFSLFPILLIYMRVKKVNIEFPKKSILVFLILSIILVRIAEFSYNIGLSKGFAAIVAPIAGANPTLFIPLAFLVFKEPVTKLQVIGIITTLSGIVLLSVFTV